MNDMDVLLAEDDRNTRDALTSVLEHLGHAVTPVADGRAAVAALELSRFDILFTDLRMPGLDGDEVIAAGLAIQPDLRIVVTSAYFRRPLETLEPAHLVGLRFLVKPFRARDIQRVLDELAAVQRGWGDPG